MKAFDRVLTMFGILLLMSFRADAHDPSMAHHEWFNRQEMNPAAQHRLGVPWKSCCNNGDVFKTRFRVADDHSDQWQYLKDGQWKVEGNVWPDRDKESSAPLVSFAEKEQPVAGKASLWGSPYAGTPIRFDDLLVTPAAAKP